MKVSSHVVQVLLAGLLGAGLSSIAIGQEVPPAPLASPESSVVISDGSKISFDQDRASITPIKGWQVEPKGSGMSLVMKEVLPVADKGTPVDYSKPLFARNITVMTMHEAAPIDEIRATAFEEEFLKMISRSGAMQDFKFNEHRLFDYKGEKDGLVFFAQHMANGFQMMQMIILVSGESKQYLLTYTDLASRFSEQQAYDAAWKSMTSIEVPGIAPKRYMREMKIGGAIAGGLLVIILPFAFARLSSQRRIRKMVNALENDWDKGSDEASTLESNISHLGVTKVTSLQTTGTEGGGWSLGTPSGMSDIKSISMVKGKMKQQYSSLG